MTSSIGRPSALTAASSRQPEEDRTVAALARLLRTQREQGAAAVALIEQSAPKGTGRLIDTWA